MRGLPPDPRFPVPEELRDFHIVETTGWTLREIDEQPAARTEWVLAIGALRNRVFAEQRAEQVNNDPSAAVTVHQGDGPHHSIVTHRRRTARG